ncbi:MAG TPA: 2-phospho-L-lactate guanylyltransferase [Actinomycetota bacterium]|nr:2-phospho-L-lactate guanylyltransferase [Actinomycetota bacterium]
MDSILIPVKRLDQAKLRLSQRLAPPDRRRLGLAMLADVLRATEKWSHRLIVTSDQDAEAVGLAFGCALVADPGLGLNAAVAAGTESAVSAGSTTLLVLPSDVPMVTSDDVTAIFASPEEVVVVPSGDGGTNALLRRPPFAIDPCFGPSSAEAHAGRAEKAGLTCRSVEMSSLILDVDRYRDLVTLGGLENLRESVRLARELLG